MKKLKQEEAKKKELLKIESHKKDLEQKFAQAQNSMHSKKIVNDNKTSNGGLFSCFFSRPIKTEKETKPPTKPIIPVIESATETNDAEKGEDGNASEKPQDLEISESADEDDVIANISYELTYSVATESLRSKTVFIVGKE